MGTGNGWFAPQPNEQLAVDRSAPCSVYVSRNIGQRHASEILRRVAERRRGRVVGRMAENEEDSLGPWQEESLLAVGGDLPFVDPRGPRYAPHRDAPDALEQHAASATRVTLRQRPWGSTAAAADRCLRDAVRNRGTQPRLDDGFGGHRPDSRIRSLGAFNELREAEPLRRSLSTLASGLAWGRGPTRWGSSCGTCQGGYASEFGRICHRRRSRHERSDADRVEVVFINAPASSADRVDVVVAAYAATRRTLDRPASAAPPPLTGRRREPGSGASPRATQIGALLAIVTPGG